MIEALCDSLVLFEQWLGNTSWCIFFTLKVLLKCIYLSLRYNNSIKNDNDWDNEKG